MEIYREAINFIRTWKDKPEVINTYLKDNEKEISKLPPLFKEELDTVYKEEVANA